MKIYISNNSFGLKANKEKFKLYYQDYKQSKLSSKNKFDRILFLKKRSLNFRNNIKNLNRMHY